MSISIVIPVFNEAENILQLVDEVFKAVTACANHISEEYEVVVVDDKSTDNTALILNEFSKTHPRVRVVQHQMNRGQSAAIYTGVCAAKNNLIFTLDGDGQNDPGYLSQFIQSFMKIEKQHMPMIVGFRQKREDENSKVLTTKIAKKLRHLIYSDETPDSGCGMKLFYRDDFKALPFFVNNHRYYTILFNWLGGSVVSVVVKHRPRMAGVSKYGFWDRFFDAFKDLIGLMWYKRSITHHPRYKNG